MNYIEKTRKYLHDLFGWGYPEELEEYDGFQSSYTCKFCEYAITRDSTSAWFHLSRKIK